MSVFSATTRLPFKHLEQATAELRAQLRRQLLAADVSELPMWETFEVTGPVEFVDSGGEPLFEYTGTVTATRRRRRVSLLARLPSIWTRL